MDVYLRDAGAWPCGCTDEAQIARLPCFRSNRRDMRGAEFGHLIEGPFILSPTVEPAYLCSGFGDQSHRRFRRTGDMMQGRSSLSQAGQTESENESQEREA